MTDEKPIAPPLTEDDLARFEDDMSHIDDRVGGGMCVVEVHDAEAVLKAARRSLTLESELAQLRREKAEREALERRRDAFLSASAFHQVRHDFDSDLVEHTVALVDWEGAELGTGPTYEAALAAVLARLEAKERGEAGDRCEAGNECGRLGCPECQQ